MAILIIGVRRKCCEAAVQLGHEVLLWSDEDLVPARKKKLLDWLISPYVQSFEEFSPKVIQFLSNYKISHVIANTEETVTLGAQVRQFLGISGPTPDIVVKFHNKEVMKNNARALGIPVTNYQRITQRKTAKDLVATLGLPLVIKPVDESGAQDVRVCYSEDEVTEHAAEGFLSESFVQGSEVSVESFIYRGEVIFHNITEYLHQWKKSLVPARVVPDLTKKILELNDRVIRGFGVESGMTHAEFYLTPNGPVFGEIALRPPGGYYMDLISRVYGINSWQAYVRLCCGEYPGVLNDSPKGAAAVIMLHPGKGKIKSISGEDAVRSHLRSIIEMRVRKHPGDEIAEHLNTSNEIGHILFWEENAQSALESIQFIEQNLVIELE